MKPCGCDGACSAACRNDRWAKKRVAALDGHSALPVTASARSRKPLKPSALRVLGRLQAGPASNRDLMNLAGFGWACRISEVRAAGHPIRCEALGPTRGMRTYTLESPVDLRGQQIAGSGGEGVTNGQPEPGSVLYAEDEMGATVEAPARLERRA